MKNPRKKMTDIQKLLNKYNSSYIPGEKRSKKYNTQINRQYRHQDRILLLDKINNQLPNTLKLNKDEKEVVTSILTVFQNDLQYLHRRAKNEAIILAIIFTIKKRTKPSLYLNRENKENREFTEIAEQYRLNEPTLITILSRITNYYMLHNPQVIYETTRYDHTILYEQEHIFR